MWLRYLLALAAALLCGCGASADVGDFTEACLESGNLERPICECCGQKAQQQLSPGGFDLLIAMLHEDQPKVDELRSSLPMQDVVKASMFMVSAPAQCAKDLQTP